MRFDVNRARECYPALAEGYVHFDSAAGSLVAVESARAIAGVTGSAVGNKTTAFEPGRRALEITAAARSAVADLVGGVPDGVVFGQSATALTYLVSRTLAAEWAPGDEVVVSRLDHDANVRPWLQAAARAGATVRWAEFDPDTGELPAEQYEKLVTDRTRVVALTAASNAIGTRPDVAAIAAIAHAAGALVYVDGVHATPHLPTDVRELGADFYVTSAYKWSGPHIAACVADPARWEGLRPEKLNPAPDTVPERFEHGTLSFELLAGVTGAVDHLAGLLDHGPSQASRRERILASMAAVHAYEQSLLERLVTGLEGIDGVRMFPASRDRCPTVSFRLGDQHPAQTSRLLAERRICVYDGDNYAFEYFDRVGLRDSGSAVRASIYHYTTEEDVQRLLDGVQAIR